MEISPTVPVEAWLENAEAAGAATDNFVQESTSLLASSGFWGTVAAGIILALKFVPQLAPAYSGVASMIGTVLAPSVHREKVKQVEQYAEHYIKAVEVIEDVANQLPDSNGVRNIKGILKKATDSAFHNAVATITKKVDHANPRHVIISSQPSSKSQILQVAN